MSGSAGDWPIGPAANPANPAPPPVSTSVASTGIILAHGFPCISTNIAKKNSTPSDSARALSWASASDMGTLRGGRGSRPPGACPPGQCAQVQPECGSGGPDPCDGSEAEWTVFT